MPVATATGVPNATQTPDGWKAVRLGDVAEVVGGSTPSRTQSEYWGGDIPWVVPSELTELAGRYLQDSRESITVDGLESAGLRILPVGSVLLTTRATIGLAAINTLPITTNQGFQSLVGKNGTDSLWLYYCISSKRRELEQRGAGSTFREVSRDAVRTLPILLPPLAEQRTIAAVLDSIDEAIERADEVIAATERLRDALLRELLARGLPGQHSEWKEVPGLGTIPASWEAVCLGDIAEVIGGSTPSRTQPKFWGGEIPWVVPSEVTELVGRELRSSRESITDEGLRAAGLRVLPARSVLLTTRATIGATAIASLPVTTNQGFQSLVGKNGIDSLWLYYCVSSKSRELMRRGAGSTFREVSRDAVRNIPVFLPPLLEQRAIAAVLDSVDAAIERAREERCDLRSLQASTSEALLSGRMRVDQPKQKGQP